MRNSAWIIAVLLCQAAMPVEAAWQLILPEESATASQEMSGAPPPKKAARPWQPPQLPPGNDCLLTVGKGDSLGSIAKEHLGSVARWREIAELNRIREPDRIRAGWTLALPCDGSARVATAKDRRPKLEQATSGTTTTGVIPKGKTTAGDDARREAAAEAVAEPETDAEGDAAELLEKAPGEPSDPPAAAELEQSGAGAQAGANSDDLAETGNVESSPETDAEGQAAELLEKAPGEPSDPPAAAELEQSGAGAQAGANSEDPADIENEDPSPETDAEGQAVELQEKAPGEAREPPAAAELEQSGDDVEAGANSENPVDIENEDPAPKIATEAQPVKVQENVPGNGSTALTCSATVKAGDSLSRIAKEHLGNAARWREIAELNRIREPDRIRAGWTLALPCEETPILTSVGAAITVAGNPAEPFLPEAAPVAGVEARPLAADVKSLWTAQASDRLDDVISEWALTAGWQPIISERWFWRFHTDYSFNGHFEDAVEDVLSGFPSTGTAPGITYFENRVLQLTYR